MEGDVERRAAIFIGPEFGTVSRIDVVAAAREATDARFDVLIACAFNFDAHASDLSKLGPLPILKAKMNPDLHMAEDLKNTGKGNLFVVFGEPDIDVSDAGGGQIKVRVNGVDVRPQQRKGRMGPSLRLMLMPMTTATTLFKERDAILDGPYAETKEALLGFYVIDCDTLEQAHEIARELAGANPGGAYEISPIRLFLPGARVSWWTRAGLSL
jgi:hypothetical protein